MSVSLAQSSRYFRDGFLTKYRILRFHGYWLLELFVGSRWEPLSPARSSSLNDDYRRFKSLDSVVKTLESIGFDVSTLTSV